MFLLTSQSLRSRFVRGLPKMVKTEGSFEERFSETVLGQLPFIFDNGSFSLDTRRLRLFLRLLLRR